MLRLAEKAFSPARDPVPGHARRHRPQLPRGAGVPRPAGRRARRPAHRRQRPGRDRARHRHRAAQRHPQPDPDPGAARGAREAPLQRALRRRPPRRGQGPGQGAGLLLPRRVRPVGPEEPAPRAVEPLQRPDPRRREHPGLPAVELDRARHLAVHPERGASSCRRSTSPTTARSSSATACSSRVNEFCRPKPGETVSVQPGPLPHRRRREPDRRRPVRRRHGRQGHRRGRRRPGSPSAAPPAATTSSARPPWKTASARGTSRWTSCGSPPPARVDDGKSTLIGRLLYDTKTIFEDQLEAVERASRDRGDELHQPRAAHRRPARRARAGHHDRRRLPLLRHAEAQVHHRRHPGAHPVHPQHGHRRLDRRPRARPGRRPQGHRRAEPPARVPRDAAAGAAPRAVRQQDGPRRLLRGGLRRTSATSSRRSPTKLRIPDLTFIPVSALKGDNVVDPLREHALVRRARACCTTSRTCTSPATATSSTSASRCSTSSARSRDELPRLPRLRRAGRRRRAQAGRRGHRPAVRLHARTIASIETADGPVDEAYPPMSVTIRLEDEIDVSRGDMICRPHNQPDRRRRTSTRWSAGWTRRRRSRPGAKYAIKHTTRTARAMVKDLHYRLDVNTLHRDEDATDAGAQRDRPGPAADDQPLLGRRVLRATARPAASSSSTRRPTAPSPPG